MSGFNPLAALGANAVAATQQAIEQSTLQIGVAAEVLQAQLSVGDLIAATILPASGGNDLLSIFGQTVIAQLPTGVYPGETLLLAVTGFVGNSIMVQNLGVADPSAPLPTVDLQFPVEEGAPQTATLTTTSLPPNVPSGASGTAVAPPNQPPQASSSPSAPVSAQPTSPQPVQVPSGTASAPPAAVSTRGAQPMAPSRAVFVAASVRPSVASGPDAGSSGSGKVVSPSSESDVEARIAAARTGSPDGRSRAVPAPPGTVRTGSPRAPQVVPPIIARGLPQTPPIMRAADAQSSAIAASRDAASVRRGVPGQSPQSAAQAARAAASPEASLLARLRVPVTTLTTAAAKMIDQAAQSVPRTFVALESLLGRVANDPRVATLRSMLGFAGKLDPSNPRALPEQLAAFVNDVLDGAESKMASIVRAFSDEPPLFESAKTVTAAPATPSAQATPTSLAGAASDALSTPQAVPTALADPSANAQARVAERVAAMDYDVKAAIMTLLQSPPSGGSPQLTQALSEALTAITALQLSALNAQNANPNTIAIPLPMFYREGGQPTVLRIDRDGGNGKPMDSENFHVSFILDTESLGTIAIDLQSAQRAVSINVKTERASAANSFRSSLGDLRSRIEGLHYRVAAIGADVAPPRGAKEAPIASEPPLEDRAPSKLDVQA